MFKIPEPHPLESSSYLLERVNGKLLVEVTQIFANSDLYASQDWINQKDIDDAIEFNHGVQSPKYQRFPTIYWSNINGRIIFIVGDGHHRLADSIIRGIPLKAEIDEELENMTTEKLLNPKVAQIKYAKFGIFGIWPFEKFMQKFRTEFQDKYIES